MKNSGASEKVLYKWEFFFGIRFVKIMSPKNVSILVLPVWAKISLILQNSLYI